MVAAWPTPAELAEYIDEGAERSVGALQEIVTAVRAIRARYTVAPKQGVDLHSQGERG